MYPAFNGTVETVENFIDVNRIRRLAKENSFINTQAQSLILCSCGRLTKEKGFDLAVEAAKQIKEKGIDFKWYFIGEGLERANIERQIHVWNLEENIFLMGFEENPYKFMASCDIYIQPSREESYGISMVECLALQKPIVSTTTIGGKYLSDHYGGLILARINGVDIAEKIADLYFDEESKKKLTEQSREIDWDVEYNRYVIKLNEVFK